MRNSLSFLMKKGCYSLEKKMAKGYWGKVTHG